MNNYAKICCLLKCARLARQLSTRLSSKPNFYELLGVSPTATATEIKIAYFEKSKLYHPDVAGQTEESSSLFRQISEAYEVLGSPTSRKEYDENVMGIIKKDSEDDPISLYRKSINDEKMYSWTKEHYNRLRKQQYELYSTYDNLKLKKKSEAEIKLYKYPDVATYIVIIICGMVLFNIFDIDVVEKIKTF